MGHPTARPVKQYALHKPLHSRKQDIDFGAQRIVQIIRDELHGRHCLPLHEYVYLVLQGQVKSGLVAMGSTRLCLALC